jgi:A/G-specific adenine glycosylase
MTNPPLRRSLLAWYDRHRRAMPWRALPGETSDPYRVWLSEIMLQQTTVATVGPYFTTFTERWPTVDALAKADLDQVLHAWQGLGYYARARNLHACAKTVAAEWQGSFPSYEGDLLTLPGIGSYTAAAIAAIAFNRQTIPVDGNVVRVVSRLFAIEEPLPGLRETVVERVAPLARGERPGDFAQALMDLGATICTPRRPACGDCPWQQVCLARAAGNPEALPRAAAKKPKPVRKGIAFWAVRGDGAVLLRRRAEKGLLGGMMEVPSTPWREGDWSLAEATAEAPVKGHWKAMTGLVRHTFTHFHLELAVVTAAIGKTAALRTEGIWCAPDDLAAHALPSLMKKVAKHAQAGPGPLFRGVL